MVCSLTLVAALICIIYFVYSIKSGEMNTEREIAELDANNKQAHSVVLRTQAKFKQDMSKAEASVDKSKMNVRSANSTFLVMQEDYEKKYNALSDELNGVKTSFQTQLNDIDSNVKKTNDDAAQHSQKHRTILQDLNSKALNLSKRIADQRVLLNEYKTAVSSRVGGISDIRKQLIGMQTKMEGMQKHASVMSTSLENITGQLANIEKIHSQISAVENRTASLSQNKYADTQKIVKEYMDVLPRLKTLPQDYVTKSTLASLEEEYKKEIPMLEANVMAVKAAAQTSTVVNELQNAVDQLKTDIKKASMLMSDLGKLKEIQAKVGDVNIAQYSEQIKNHLPKLGKALENIGDVNVQAFKDQLPLLSQVPSLVSKLGDVNLAPYKNQLNVLSRIPDIKNEMATAEITLKTIDRNLPNAQKSIASLDVILRNLRRRLGNTDEIKALQKVIDDYKTVMTVSNGSLTAKNGLCIRDICITAEQLKSIISGNKAVCPTCPGPQVCPTCT